MACTGQHGARRRDTHDTAVADHGEATASVELHDRLRRQHRPASGTRTISAKVEGRANSRNESRVSNDFASSLLET